MVGRVVRRERRDPNTLSLSPFNVRKELNREHYDHLLRSVEATGEILYPIIINTRDEVVAGQHRWRVAKELGMDIECIVKEYENPYEQMIDSLLENHLHLDVSGREKGEVIVYLKDECGMKMKDISRVLGYADPSTVTQWYKKIKGPEAISEEKEEQDIEEQKQKEEKKEEKPEKKKEKKESKKKTTEKTLDKIVQETEEEKKIREAYEKAREIYNTFGLRTATTIRRILDHPHFKKDIWRSLELLQYAKEFLPLRELDNIAKNLKYGILPDFEYLKKVYTSKHEYTMRSVRIRKDLLKRARKILKRRNMNTEHMIEEALRDWVEKWEKPETWEEELEKEDIFETWNM